MEKRIIYGVFAIDVELPTKSDSRQEIKDIADSMKSLDDELMHTGRFVRAYGSLEDAVSDCYDGNGWLLTKTLEVPDGVVNGKSHSYYFPKAITVVCR